MISSKGRETRRNKNVKLSKNIQRLFEEKCKECTVVVTRMDFAKILGKFTKVKIQYESGSSPKTKKETTVTSPNTNSRLKNNENGMVLLHRNAYKPHPVKEGLSTRRSKSILSTPQTPNNVLKENNRLKRPISTPTPKKTIQNKVKPISSSKQYAIIFDDPQAKNTPNKNKGTLMELLPNINNNILPSEEWCIDYLPSCNEPKEDKVYDRIAAELEDLMYNEEPESKSPKKDQSTTVEPKADDFPSIMDILNDSATDATNKTSNINGVPENKSNLDVEAMLLGKPDEKSKELIPVPMVVDNTPLNNLIEDMDQLQPIENIKTEEVATPVEVDNPQSPSILDETLQKCVEEQIPAVSSTKDEALNNNNIPEKKKAYQPPLNTITHVVFKLSLDGKCLKSVTCPKNLKYSIELDDKTVEFLGAPNFISSLEDLKVLLQIVNESDLNSLYVFH